MWKYICIYISESVRTIFIVALRLKRQGFRNLYPTGSILLLLRSDDTPGSILRDEKNCCLEGDGEIRNRLISIV